MPETTRGKPRKVRIRKGGHKAVHVAASEATAHFKIIKVSTIGTSRPTFEMLIWCYYANTVLHKKKKKSTTKTEPLVK